MADLYRYLPPGHISLAHWFFFVAGATMLAVGLGVCRNIPGAPISYFATWISGTALAGLSAASYGCSLVVCMLAAVLLGDDPEEDRGRGAGGGRAVTDLPIPSTNLSGLSSGLGAGRATDPPPAYDDLSQVRTGGDEALPTSRASAELPMPSTSLSSLSSGSGAGSAMDPAPARDDYRRQELYSTHL